MAWPSIYQGGVSIPHRSTMGGLGVTDGVRHDEGLPDLPFPVANGALETGTNNYGTGIRQIFHPHNGAHTFGLPVSVANQNGQAATECSHKEFAFIHELSDAAVLNNAPAVQIRGLAALNAHLRSLQGRRQYGADVTSLKLQDDWRLFGVCNRDLGEDPTHDQFTTPYSVETIRTIFISGKVLVYNVFLQQGKDVHPNQFGWLYYRKCFERRDSFGSPPVAIAHQPPRAVGQQSLFDTTPPEDVEAAATDGDTYWQIMAGVTDDQTPDETQFVGPGWYGGYLGPFQITDCYDLMESENGLKYKGLADAAVLRLGTPAEAKKLLESLGSVAVLLRPGV
jgi:hypothetical protein